MIVMTLQAWVDADLTRDLSMLRQKGEGQNLEYKREFPQQATDLSKVIASFATSNEGLILLGVADNGDVVGIPDGADAATRDAVSQRIEGICRQIHPPVHVQLHWAIEGDFVVLGIRVPKGREPLYYVNYQPFLRRTSSSRPAQPSEVVDAVREWIELGTPESPEESHKGEFITALAAVLVKVVRWGDTDAGIRERTPWFDEWTGAAGSCADHLRELAADDMAGELGFVESLKSLAQELDGIANFRPVLSGGPSFDDASNEAGSAAKEIFNRAIATIPMKRESSQLVRKEVEKAARILSDAWARAEQNPFGGEVEEAQKKSGQTGRRLMEWSNYPLEFLSAGNAQRLLEIGHRLLVLEAVTLYYDGGESQRRVIEAGAATTVALSAFIDQAA
jgi:hypothetical protein